jgi:hypothetical protein
MRGGVGAVAVVPIATLRLHEKTAVATIATAAKEARCILES